MPYAGGLPVIGAVDKTGDTMSGDLTLQSNLYKKVTITTIDAQNGTPTIAQLLGGVIAHNSKTGSGTLTTPTGAQISAGITGVAIGHSFDVLYDNYGNQTVTVTAGASGVTVKGTAAVTTLKCAILRFVCTAANTWNVYVIWG